VVNRSEHAQGLRTALVVQYFRRYLEVVLLEESSKAFDSQLLARHGQAWDHGKVVTVFASAGL
jgi:hypothetical protein